MNAAVLSRRQERLAGDIAQESDCLQLRVYFHPGSGDQMHQPRCIGASKRLRVTHIARFSQHISRTLVDLLSPAMPSCIMLIATTAFRHGCSEQKWSGDAHNEKRITIVASATDLFHSIFRRDLQASLPQIRPPSIYDGSFLIKLPRIRERILVEEGKWVCGDTSRASNAEDYYKRF